MKVLAVMTMLLVLSVTGYAQAIGPQFRQAPPIKKELKLKDFGKSSLLELKPLKRPESITSRAQKSASLYKGFSTALKPLVPARLKSGMPIMKPDSTINFHMLALRPDSTIHHYLRIKKLK